MTEKPNEVLVLGVDPGTAVTGYGLVTRREGGAVALVECGVIRTSPDHVLADRIREIYEGIVALIVRHQAGTRSRGYSLGCGAPRGCCCRVRSSAD